MATNSKSLVNEGFKFSCFRYNIQYFIHVLKTSTSEGSSDALSCCYEWCSVCPLLSKSEEWENFRETRLSGS